jgi:hypothetical protein
MRWSVAFLGILSSDHFEKAAFDNPSFIQTADGASKRELHNFIKLFLNIITLLGDNSQNLDCAVFTKLEKVRKNA